MEAEESPLPFSNEIRCGEQRSSSEFEGVWILIWHSHPSYPLPTLKMAMNCSLGGSPPRP